VEVVLIHTAFCPWSAEALSLSRSLSRCGEATRGCRVYLFYGHVCVDCRSTAVSLAWRYDVSRTHSLHPLALAWRKCSTLWSYYLDCPLSAGTMRSFLPSADRRSAEALSHCGEAKRSCLASLLVGSWDFALNSFFLQTCKFARYALGSSLWPSHSAHDGFNLLGG